MEKLPRNSDPQSKDFQRQDFGRAPHSNPPKIRKQILRLRRQWNLRRNVAEKADAVVYSGSDSEPDPDGSHLRVNDSEPLFPFEEAVTALKQTLVDYDEQTKRVKKLQEDESQDSEDD